MTLSLTFTVLTSPMRRFGAVWCRWLQQIEEKGYAMPYIADSRKLYKVGISFSSETGTINDFGYC
ncbi:PD-(D/E)XK nuclease domain-containing protein, partial [Parabacteroides distasonis]|nr:PD-(D/E)XK nuclease domain-containing protein [Parabacteroides distasonis]